MALSATTISPDNIILVDPDEYDCQFVIHGARQDIAYHPTRDITLLMVRMLALLWNHQDGPIEVHPFGPEFARMVEWATSEFEDLGEVSASDILSMDEQSREVAKEVAHKRALLLLAHEPNGMEPGMTDRAPYRVGSGAIYCRLTLVFGTNL